VAALAEPCVLRVISDGGGVGSGFVIHPSGLAITNAHVVSGSGGGVAQLVDRHVRFDVIARGPSRDLALLKLQGTTDTASLHLGMSSDMALGAPVLAVGAPQGMFPVVTTGVLGGRSVPGTIAELLVPLQLIHGAPTLRGSSGCPLLDIHGRVIGIQSAKPGQELVMATAAEDEEGRLFDRDLGRWRFQTEAFGLAIPVEDALRYLPAFVAPEWSTGLASGFTCEAGEGEGALVRSVAPGSPAERAGLRVGDLITLSFGQTVLSVVDLSASMLSEGASLLSVKRGGGEAFIKFTREPWARPGWPELASGLAWKAYPGLRHQLEDIDARDGADTGVVESVSLPDSYLGRDGFTLELLGWIDVPEDGRWTFELESDDGSQLYLRDKLVVDCDGLHSRRAVTGAVDLLAGPQPIRVLFFEAVGEEFLRMRWALEGGELRPVSTSDLRHREGVGW